MTRGRKVVVGAIVIGALAAGVYAIRMPLLLNFVGLRTDLVRPRAPNQPVPWQQGPETAAVPPAQRPPNVVVIIADDLGYNEVSTHGGGIPLQPTPHIDALGRDGVRFDFGYAGNAVCSPSRANLLTGRYASRFGFEFTPTPGNMAKVAPMLTARDRLRRPVLHHDVVGRIKDFDELGMPPAEQTIAELLKARGYHTIHIGKWHLGGTPELRPNNQGFDESLYMESGLYLPEDDPQVVNSKQDFDPIDRFLWANMRYATSYNGGEWFEPRGYLTDYYTDEAINAIHANRHQPFFLYLAHWAVHTPLQAAKADYDALAAIPDHRARVEAAMVRALDRSVGRIVQALKDEGLDDNTLIFFTSDNGAPNYLGLPDVNRPFRGWKLTYFEGGIRVPFVAKWPARIPAGQTFGHPIASIDILPTVAAAAGVALPRDTVIDGVNLLPYLDVAVAGDAGAAPHDALFFSDGTYQAVIARGWKMQVSQRPNKVWLYHLEKDPTERDNLAEREPAKVAELRSLLAAHNNGMAPPAWPSFIEVPVSVDKTLDQPEAETDEHVYWQN